MCADRLTKHTKLIPHFMGEDLLNPEQVALLFCQNLVRYLGSPMFFIYDRGLIFTSNFLQSLLKLLGSRAMAIFAHHPQADGQTEQINHTIGKILGANILGED